MVISFIFSYLKTFFVLLFLFFSFIINSGASVRDISQLSNTGLHDKYYEISEIPRHSGGPHRTTDHASLKRTALTNMVGRGLPWTTICK